MRTTAWRSEPAATHNESPSGGGHVGLLALAVLLSSFVVLVLVNDRSEGASQRLALRLLAGDGGLAEQLERGLVGPAPTSASVSLRGPGALVSPGRRSPPASSTASPARAICATRL
jgi:hypothetical protein